MGWVNLHILDSVTKKWVPWHSKPDSSGGNAANVLLSQPSNLMSSGTNLTPTAGQNQLWQLWNPASSGINLVVQHITMNMGADGTLQAFKSTAALTSQDTVNLANLNFEGSAPVGEIRYQSNGTPAGKFSDFAMKGASIEVPMWWLTGTVITPGTGLVFKHASTDVKLKTKISWSEVTR